jgi:hypothetical protein
MKYDKFELKCGHIGNIVWRSSDGEVMGVRGTRRSCDVCFRSSDSGRTPTVHVITRDVLRVE